MSRELLGVADVSDEQLAAMVGTLLDEPSVAVCELDVQTVDYDLPAITTAGRWWVSGRADTSRGVVPFRLFVKHVQNWSRSPQFAQVPAELREMAAASVPWRTEPNVYRSDLAGRLPYGLAMPRAVGVYDLDELSSAIWLEAVPMHDWPWDTDRFERAAYLLGRLAGKQSIAPLAQIDDHRWTVRDYLNGRFENQVAPMVRDDDLWRHPLLAAGYSDHLRARMLDALDHVPAWVDELARAPHLPGHGDACPNNLLGTAQRDSFVLIDFGFWKPLPMGFDLGQLLLGDIQIGRRDAEGLDALDARLVPAYVSGLRAEGHHADTDTVARLHALQMAVFTGLSTMPFEHLHRPIDADLRRLAAARAAITAYCLDRVDATSPL